MTKGLVQLNEAMSSAMLSDEALQITIERRKVKSKGEKERYTTGFQRIVSTLKTAFLNEQFREVEENYRMGKTRDFFRKIGDIRGTVHANMGTGTKMVET